MSAVEILREARALIAEPKRWTQGEYARDSRGASLPPREEGAVCWCAIGAIEHVTKEKGSDEFNEAYDLLRSTAHLLHGEGIASVNDGRVNLGYRTPHQAVLRLYDKAISKAEAANA